MKKHLLSFILMVAGAGGAYAAEPVMGIVCSYAGQEAFFPLTDAPQVKYETKEGVQHAVVLVGGVEKLSIALVNGGTLTVSYDSRALHEHNYAEAWSSDATNHWHACTGGECDAKSDEAAHSYGQVTTQTSYYTCSVCQYVNTTRQNEYNSATQAAADQAAATNVTNMINGIGTVVYTTECNGKITSARAAYDNLTAGQKSLVSNLQTLTDAEAAYADLTAAAAVVTKINAIGTVEHTEASKALIDDARAAYDALTATQKAIVTDAQLQVLTDAEAEYARLKAIDDVEDVIAAIGEVEYTEEGKDECWAKIDAARQAYDALPCVTDQAEVENYQTLLDAEAEWDRLVAALLKSTLVVTESKWATFVAPYAVNLPKGVTAYTIPGVESNKATLMMEEVEGKLPANTPVVIYSDEPVVKEYVLPFIVGIPQEGIMVGVLVNTDIRSGYVLQNQNDLVGFYQVNGIKTIPANRAYIAQSASTDGIDDDRVKAYFFDTATALKALAAMADGKAEIYDMNGRKQSRLQKGINIVNGVKVLVK